MSYTNSSLISETLLSPYHKGTRTHLIDTITIHCMANPVSIKCCGQFYTIKEAPSNYGIDETGAIGLFVEESNCSQATQNLDNDNRAITIEVAAKHSDEYRVTSSAYQSLVNLVADICLRNQINKLIWSNNLEDRVNHADGCNMTLHRDFVETDCPGEYLYTHMQDVANQANKLILSGKVCGKSIISNQVENILSGFAGCSGEAR